MNDKIRQGMKNSRGSSLAFVLIISMVLMIMVASIMTVANSDFTFTQKTVESRQAYIDAKSVIEFGKVEIYRRMTALKKIDELIKGEKDPAILLSYKNQRTALIGTLANTFTIYGVKDSVTENLKIETLSLSPTPTPVDGKVKDPLGIGTVAPPVADSTITQYAFDIKTQNLRRKLDYNVDFNYSDVPVVKPAEASWLKTDIYTDKDNSNGNDKSYGEGRVGIKIVGQNDVLEHKVLTVNVPNLSLNIGKDDTASNTGFKWLNFRTLNLTANNIYLTDPLPTTQTDGSPFGKSNDNKITSFNMTATNIIFPGELTIGDNVTLNLTCDNLWVGGNITLGTNSILTVTGTTGKTTNQMIVEGQIIRGTDSKLNLPVDYPTSSNSGKITNGLESYY